MFETFSILVAVAIILVGKALIESEPVEQKIDREDREIERYMRFGPPRFVDGVESKSYRRYKNEISSVR